MVTFLCLRLCVQPNKTRTTALVDVFAVAWQLEYILVTLKITTHKELRFSQNPIKLLLKTCPMVFQGGFPGNDASGKQQALQHYS